MSGNLYTDVKLLGEVINDLYTDVDEMKQGFSNGPGSLDPDIIAREMLDEMIGLLRDIERDLATVIGKRMGQTYHTVPETGETWKRSPRIDATKVIDDDGLFRYVTDTRIVDPDTGEIIPPTEVILRAYGVKSKETGKVRLTGATPTKIDDLGIDSRDFFEKGDLPKKEDGSVNWDAVKWTIKRK